MKSDQHRRSPESKAYSTKRKEQALNYADIESIKAAGITDMDSLVKQQTVQQQFEKEKKNSEHHRKRQQVQKELGMEDSQALDSLILDSEVQQQLIDAASYPKREGDVPDNKHYDVHSAYASDSPAITSPNDNSDCLQVGALVQFGTPPHYGVIRWIGRLPTNYRVMAGVEMVGYEHA